MPRNEVMEFITRVGLVGADCKNCPWMKYAIEEIGVKETKGPDSTPRVVEYLKTCGLTDDETPWCSTFVHWCMKSAKVDTTRAGNLALAIHWMSWGKPLAGPRFGAVVVLKRPPNPSAGHVAFYLGEYSDQFLLLGGNQGDEVCVASYERSNLLGYRWSNKTFGGEAWA